MAFIARLILVILCVLMFGIQRKYKIAILILSTICFNYVILPISFGAGKYIMSICFFMSEIPYLLKHFKRIRKSIIWNIILISLVAIVIQLFNSPHYNDSVKNILKLFIEEFVSKYLALAYAYACVLNERDMYPTIKVSFYGLLVLTAFGILNYSSGHATFITELGKGLSSTDTSDLLGDRYSYVDRFRVQAMFYNPFDYGYICLVLFVLHGYGFLKRMLSKRQYCISVICCLLGISTCGCRTVIVSAFVALITYILFSSKLKKRFQYLLSVFFVGIVAYSTVPYIKYKVDSTLTAFDPDVNYGGSSIELRLLQYTTVFNYIQGYEWFGRGKGYFNIDMGWSEGAKGLIDRDFAGLEGVFMNFILETGIVGTALYLTIYGILIIYLYKRRHVDKQLSALSITLFIIYFSFANMTGELGSVFPTLLVMGSFISILDIESKQLIRESDRL